jgi:LuxR family maltose regulon positive regulatory protein
VQLVAPTLSAVAHIETNDLAAASAAAKRSIDFATRNGIGDFAETALARCIVARTTEDAEEAIAAAQRGVELARRWPERVVCAYALASGGDVLCHHGHPDGAGLIAEARRMVDQCADPGIAGRYLARVEARHQLQTPQPERQELIVDLTDRELAVLRYLPSQLSQREIAGELYVSLNTVKTHCKAIYRKLGASGRKAAVQVARDAGLL